MRIAFRATAGGIETDEDTHEFTCTFCGSGPGKEALCLYITRSFLPSGQPEDEVFQFLFADVAATVTRWSEAARVRRCRLSRESLAVDIDSTEVQRIDIELALNDESWDEVRSGLEKMFDDMPGVLTLPSD